MSKNFKKMLSYYKPYRCIFWADMFFATVSAAVALAIPLVIRYVTYTLVYEDKAQIMFQIKIIAAALFAMVAADCYSKFFISNYGHVMGAKIEYNMRAEIFEHLQKLSFSFYDNQKVGQLMSRITTDLFDLAAGWAELRSRDPMTARISLSADCGPVVVNSSLSLAAQTVSGQRIQTVSKNGLRLYFTDKGVVNENGIGVTEQESSLADASKLLELAYSVCLNGQFSKAETDLSTAYIVTMDGDAMAELLDIIAPEAKKLDISLTSGTLILRMNHGTIIGLDVTCTGTAKVVLATVSVQLSAAVTFTQEEAPEIPDGAAAALLK